MNWPITKPHYGDGIWILKWFHWILRVRKILFIWNINFKINMSRYRKWYLHWPIKKQHFGDVKWIWKWFHWIPRVQNRGPTPPPSFFKNQLQNECIAIRNDICIGQSENSVLMMSNKFENDSTEFRRSENPDTF